MHCTGKAGANQLQTGIDFLAHQEGQLCPGKPPLYSGGGEREEDVIHDGKYLLPHAGQFENTKKLLRRQAASCGELPQVLPPCNCQTVQPSLFVVDHI